MSSRKVLAVMVAVAAVAVLWAVPASATQHVIRVWVHKQVKNQDPKPLPGARFSMFLTSQCIEKTKTLTGVTDDTGAIVFNVDLDPRAESYAAKVTVNGKMREFFTFKPKSKDLYYTVTLPAQEKR